MPIILYKYSVFIRTTPQARTVVSEEIFKEAALPIIRDRTSVGSVNIVPGMSDHEGVTAECETNIQTNKKQPRTVFIHRKANKDRIEEHLKQFSEEFMSSCKDRNCSENWELFKDSIKNAMEDHIPTKVLSGRWNLPWMNTHHKKTHEEET